MFKKVRASALQFAVLIAVIVFLLLGSFLALTHTHQFFNQSSQLLLEVVEASNQGVLASTSNEEKNLKQQSEIAHVILSESWGGFEKISSAASSGSKEFNSIGLLGAVKGSEKTGVYVADNQLPLVLVGNTQIEGASYISDKGVKAGVISGNYYNGKELIFGPIRRSSGALPSLNEKWLLDTKKWLGYIPQETDSVIVITQKHGNSFSQKTAVVYEQGVLQITGTFRGNILLKSNTEIIVDNAAILEDVFVIAPKITIQKGFKGSGHFLASEQLFLEEDIRLSYPSSLVLVDSNTDVKKRVPKGEAPIYISENSKIHGTIIYLPKESIETHTNTSIQITEKVQLNGDIYCEGNIEIEGDIEGTVYTNRFVSNVSGSTYVNHIFNGKVLGTRISSDFCGLPLDNTKKGIVQWLY